MVKKSAAKSVKKPVSSKAQKQSKTKVAAKPKQEKKVVSTKPKVERKESEFTKDDMKLIENSFKLVKNLNSQVSKVQEVKERLQKDVVKLGQRLDLHEKNVEPKKEANVLAVLKDELIKEFEPILKKFNLKTIKVDMFKEVGNVVEAELAKVKSEIDSTSKRTHRDFNKKFSELELRLVDSLSANDKIKRELKNFESKKVAKITAELEEKIKVAIDNASKTLYSNYVANTNQLEFMKEELRRQKDVSTAIQSSLEGFKEQLKKELTDDGVDLSMIESKIQKIEQDMVSQAALIEKYENDLYERKKGEEIDMEKKFSKMLEKAKSEINEVHRERGATEEFLVDKVNEIIDQVNTFEDKFKKNEKLDIENIKKDTIAFLKSDVDNLVGVELVKIEDEKKRLMQDVFAAKMAFDEIDVKAQKNAADVLKIISDFKNEVDLSLKGLSGENIQMRQFFEKKSAEIEILEKQIDKMLAKKLEVQRGLVNAEIAKLESLGNDISNLNRESVVKTKENFAAEMGEKLVIMQKANDDAFAKQLVSINEFMTRLSTQNREEVQRLTEDIENKFVVAKLQFEGDYDEHLKSFDNTLQAKQNEFVEKMNALEVEKSKMIDDLTKFKEDLTLLTKNYIDELHTEFDKIKTEEANFETQKDEFMTQIQRETKARVQQLEDTGEEVGKKLVDVINEQKEIFDRHENTFRDVFMQKISNLAEVQTKKLDNIERKFIDKNVRVVKDRIREEIKALELFEERLTSKEDEFRQRVEMMLEKEENFEADVLAQEEQLKEKVEERLVGLEKQLNKRFLEIDSNFTSFKGIVVDEMEDLMNDVKKLVDDKAAELEGSIIKANFVAKEVAKRTKEFEELKSSVEPQISDLRDEVNDMRIKLEIISPTHMSMNDHVHHMSAYEDQLISLIESLKKKYVPDEHIKEVLVKKGHPKFYVSMIVDNFDEIYN